MKNIVAYLQRRQIFQVEWAKEQQLASSLPTQQVLLSDILDSGRQLINSHVILGFSRCGQFLLSYRSELDVTATHSSYTLHWWRFLGHRPLQYVFKEPLFRGECVPAELHLLVCHTPSSDTVVVGCRRSCTEDFRRPCYVTIIPSFLSSSTASSKHYSLHFKFDLIPPFPAFIPSLSLRAPNCVVLNTGDGIVALHYSFTSAAKTCPGHVSTSSQNVYSSQLTQLFATDCHLPSTATLSGSPAPHLLPIDVYLGDQLMADVPLHCDKGAVCLQQVTLDVEVWVNKTLQMELTSQGMSYHSLTDYDLQLAEVCAGSGCVVLILVVLLEASPMSAVVACLGSYSVEVMASWNMHTGIIHCHRMSRLKPARTVPVMLELGVVGVSSLQSSLFPTRTGARQWNPAAPLALSYRHRYYSPQLALTSVRAFSNHSVFSGKSLRFLHHPFLPLCLTLVPSPYPSPAQH